MFYIMGGMDERTLKPYRNGDQRYERTNDESIISQKNTIPH